MTSKYIVVVGASRGIGKALVEKLAENPEYQILALSRQLDKMKSAFTALTNVRCAALDLAEANVRTKATEIFNTLPRIDILIHNAGALVNKPFTELTAADIQHCYAVNVMGVMQVTQAAVGKMDQAHIVNISSMGGFQGSMKFAGLSAYSTSKAALCSFTELFAEEYKDTGIRCNCLCLGAVQTEMLDEAFPGYQAPLTASQMAAYVANFATTAHQWMNGKIIPVSLSTP
jgi:NAD(P)-dependent dehydrogenase (short-subunit alcohol dehydrogenase family)